jgi:hypothetical protein
VALPGLLSRSIHRRDTEFAELFFYLPLSALRAFAVEFPNPPCPESALSAVEGCASW